MHVRRFFRQGFIKPNQFVLLFLFFIYALAACSRPVHAGEDWYLDGNVQKLFTSGEGLPATAANAIAQTSEGFIWIGGYGGLTRYDGQSFQNIGEGEIISVTDLLAGEDGALWIATPDKGIFLYQNGSLTACMPEEESWARETQCLSAMPDGSVCFGTNCGAGILTAEGELTQLEIPGVDGTFISRILALDDGRILFVSRKGDFLIYDGSTCRAPDLGEEKGKIRSVYYCRADGNFYLGTTGDKVVRADWSFTHLLPLTVSEVSCINDIYSSDGKTFWLCSDTGVAAFQLGRIRLQRLLLDNSVDGMMRDHQGNYWFFSSRQGVLEVLDSRFDNISQTAGLRGLVVNAVVRLGGRLYIGHDQGLMILDARDYKVIYDPRFSELESVRIRCLYADEEENLWVATRGLGLLCYTRVGECLRYSSEKYPQILSDNFRCIVPYEEGGLLAGTDAGAYHIQGDEVTGLIADPEDGSRRVLCIAPMNGRIWLGTDGYGIFAVEDSRVVQHLTTEDGLLSNVVMKFCSSPSGSGLWMVTGSGINRLDVQETIHTLSFPSSNELDFVITPAGEVWILAGTGVYQTREELLLGDDDADILYHRYTRTDGLPFEVTANSNQWQDPDLIYICGSAGLMSISTSGQEKQDGDYQVVIESMQTDLDQGAVCVRSIPEYHMDAYANRVEINAHPLNFRLERPPVFYYLEGFDRKWVIDPTGVCSPISYTNLNGGHYVFHYGLMDPNTGEVVAEAVLPFVKEFRWYERKDVRAALTLLCLALCGLLVWAWTRYQLRKENHRITQEYERNERLRLQEAAYKDYLTGLYNRNYLSVWNKEELPGITWPVAFVAVDCNNLKKVNDTYGHSRGDEMLQILARMLNTHFPEKNCRVIRMGGDEYLVLCAGLDEQAIRKIMDTMVEDAAKCMIEELPLSFSYGICVMEKDEFDFEEGLRVSDMRMLEDKDRYHGRRR